MRVTIGRDESNDILLSENSISLNHAEFIIEDFDTIVVRDLDSTNGTWYENRRVKSAQVEITSKLSFGRVDFDFTKHFKIANGIIKSLKDPNDFTNHFSTLETIESDYEKKLDELAKSSSTSMFYFRLCMIAMSICGMSRIVLNKAFESFPLYIQAIPLIAAAVFGIFAGAFYFKSTKMSQSRDKERKVLKDHFKIDFCCPSCNNFIFDSTYVMKLKETYNCRYCKAILYNNNKTI